MAELEIEAIPVTRVLARVLIETFTRMFEPCGWTVAHYGSTASAEVGRDVDVMVVQSSEDALPVEELLALLEEMTFEAKLDERKDALHERGVVGVLAERVIVDFTFVGPVV